jgi:hypothetical protein
VGAAIQPVFIFSIPRSGSTLLQRVLAAHDGVATTSEPWLLLPLAYSLRPTGIDGEYVHASMVQAIRDFCSQLPEGSKDYEGALRDAVLKLYRRAAGPKARYFLDKSPPYCLVASEIMRLFPDGKFIFLWRNPLSVVASIIETWEPWRPTLFRDDLFAGLPRLVSASLAAGARAHSVRFEDLAEGDHAALTALTSYLGLEFQPESLQTFASVELNGRMGDPTGVHRYSRLSAEPREKWRRTFSNPVRRAWMRRYLNVIGRERLAVMGYAASELELQLDLAPAGLDALGGDILRMIVDIAKEPVRVRTRSSRLAAPNVIRQLAAARPGRPAGAAPGSG